jgi:hypothetical protein
VYPEATTHQAAAKLPIRQPQTVLPVGAGRKRPPVFAAGWDPAPSRPGWRNRLAHQDAGAGADHRTRGVAAQPGEDDKANSCPHDAADRVDEVVGTSRRSHGLKLPFAASFAATLLLGSVVILASGNLQWH